MNEKDTAGTIPTCKTQFVEASFLSYKVINPMFAAVVPTTFRDMFLFSLRDVNNCQDIMLQCVLSCC